jgi:ABC-type transport system involved in cytochrome c biogenesis permease subunit
MIPAPGRSRLRLAMALVAAALALHTGAIGLRWVRLGHGPYVDLFEILSSNVWSLHLVLLAACATFRHVRNGLPGALAVLTVLVLWLMVTPAGDTDVPVTYATFWLPVHMVLGKLFLGLVVAATGLALAVLTRRLRGEPDAADTPSGTLEALAHRLMLAAVVFQSLMLVAGAAWARDAWGRYWAWDPLESWAFLSWIAMLAYLHWRPRNPEATALSSAMIVGVYALAFMTFFGVPFLSVAPHKGAV